VRFDAELSDADVERIASRVAELLGQKFDAEPEGWLTPDGAARYLGVSRKRIYDLRSMRAIEPDGRDGRTPLFRRATLDAYARSSRVAP
jgi:excisionase family DNA binding protein